jgi:uncharacterized YigZ family protein
MNDTYLTLDGPAIGEFKDRGSKFIGLAYPVTSELDIHEYLERLRKEHFKANHHCFAWRLGREGTQFRANDDGEPSGTAGRPILAQIDAANLTNTVVIVVRYFGGTLLGASGLINAYRETAAETLRAATIREVILHDDLLIHADYAIMPDVVQAIHKLGITIREEQFDDRAHIAIAIRQRDTQQKLLQLKAQVRKVSVEEAETLEWPDEMEVSYEL